jgi:hypothetical protein
MPISHWMTFATFNEQRYFAYPKEKSYDGVVLNANMVAHAREGIAAFLMSKTEGLPYVIDPLTHAFQHEPSAIRNRFNELKTSIASLSQYYGAPVADIAGTRPLVPSDFSDRGVLDGFVGRCLQFQKESLSGKMAESEWNQYLLQPSAALEPLALVSPYLFINEGNFRRWFPTMVAFVASAFKQRGTSKLFVPIVLSKGALISEEIRGFILQYLAEEQLDGFLLWIDDLDESEAAGDTLRALLALARGLKKRPEQHVINLHGGYFSILAGGNLGSGALSGVAHGPEFGEHRAVVPVGGGIPRPKFYVPQLHTRIAYREAQAYLQELGLLADSSTFFENVCDCAECRAVLAAGIGNFTSYGDATVKLVKRDRGFTRMEFPTSVAKQQCLRHYLQRKAREFDFAANSEPAVIMEDLRSGYFLFRDAAPESVGHLAVWAKVFGADMEPAPVF